MTGWLYDDGAPLAIELIVFDKDGTLLDFTATWLPGYRACAQRVAAESGEPALEPALLKVGGWVDDPDNPRWGPDALLVHGTYDAIAQMWIDTQPIVAARYPAATAMVPLLEATLLEATVRDATPLGPVEATLTRLQQAGMRLSVVTNDTEALARAQLAKLGLLRFFESVIGADSGFGAKPEGGGIRAAIEKANVEPSASIMVGDSTSDMAASDAAGCAFSVAIHPEGSALPAGLTAAACRMPSIESLPSALAAAGQSSLRGERSSRHPLSGRAAAAMAGASPAAAVAAAYEEGDEDRALGEVDPEIIAAVEGMRYESRSHTVSF